MDSLQRLLSLEEIRQLKSRYFRCVDTRDYDGLAQVFCEDAVFDCTEGSGVTPEGGDFVGAVGPVTHGREAIVEWIRTAMAQITSVHHGHGHEIAFDSDTEARGIVAMEDYLNAPDRQTCLWRGAGHYHERYRIEDGAWRIAETRLTRLFRVVH
jgi:ketosteroid isomerase-like protein